MKTFVLACVLTAAAAVTGNAEDYDSNGILDPKDPVTLTIWHYYNGAHQAAFEKLVEEFNNTVGRDLGIYVEDYRKGSVTDLETAITDAAKGAIGAEDMPDLFECKRISCFTECRQFQ